MLRLRHMKTVEEHTTEHANADDDVLLHGKQVLKTLVPSWTNSNRIVCAYSYFASIGCLEELKINNLCFICVVKMTKKGYP